MACIERNKADEAGYNEYYKDNLSPFAVVQSPEQYISVYEEQNIAPYWKGGCSKGYVRGEAVKGLVNKAAVRGKNFADITVLDAGFGQGELSVYLACRGFSVVGVDISAEAKVCADMLASTVGVSNRVSFLAESLEATSIPDNSIDYVIGHASLHHFIKYEKVPEEFKRIMKPAAEGFFADSFGENKLYHLFHDKAKMERLGDVTLTKSLIESYFKDFEITLTPTDWFVMFDKAYKKFLPRGSDPFIRRLSLGHFWLDRRIPHQSRLALYLSGSVLTKIKKTS